MTLTARVSNLRYSLASARHSAIVWPPRSDLPMPWLSLVRTCGASLASAGEALPLKCYCNGALASRFAYPGQGETIRLNAAAPAMLAVSGLDLLRDLPKLIYPGRGPSTTRGWKLLLDIVQLAGHLGQFVPKAKRGAAPYDLVELVLDA